MVSMSTIHYIYLTNISNFISVQIGTEGHQTKTDEITGSKRAQEFGVFHSKQQSTNT